MDPRQRWQALQAQLTIARAQLEAGNHAEALAAVDQALAIDPDFLAALSLRDHVLSLAPASLISSPPPRPARVPAVLAPIAVEPAPAQAVAPPLPPAPSSPEPTPVVVAAAPPPPIVVERYAQFEQRAKRRRVDRRLEAARSAIALGRVKDAAAALDEVIALDPNLPDVAELTAQFEALRRTSRPAHRGRWLAAAAVFAGIVLGASWLQESRGLLSRPVVSIAPLVAPPEPFGVAVEASAPAPDFDTVATSGDVSPAPPVARDSIDVARVEPREAPVVRAVEPPPTADRPLERRPPETVSAAAFSPVNIPGVASPPVVQRSVPESRELVAPVTGATASPIPPPPPPAASPASSVVAQPDDEFLVKQTLQRYRTAYEGLDARSARAVWPAVNEDALARAFNGLESQTLVFDACDVRLRGDAAAATCRGSARYVPKVGNHETRTEPRTWTFTLKKAGADWRIESARAER